MSQIEGAVLQDTVNFLDCDDREYADWLQENNLTKFYVPLKEYLGIDSIESCCNLDAADIPRVCQNIPNDVKLQYGILFKDEMMLKKHLKMLISKRLVSQQEQQPQPLRDRIVRNLTEEESVYFDKLVKKQKELKLLLNETIINQEKQNEKRYKNTLNNYQLFFNQLCSKLTEISQKQCGIIKTV